MSDAKRGTEDTVRSAVATAETLATPATREAAARAAGAAETLPSPASAKAAAADVAAGATLPAPTSSPSVDDTLPAASAAKHVADTQPANYQALARTQASGADATLASSVGSGVDDTVRAGSDGGAAELPEADRSTYELREVLGAGGMGKVVVARDKRLGRLLAVKVAKVSDPGLRVRFTREAVLTARLQHPSIIPVHEAGVWPGEEPFYAMKLVAGAPLSKLIAKTTTLDERLALIPNLIAVVDALAYAHAQSVIHRDLKPDNVIVGEYGETIVIDWGLAKELDSDDEAPGASTPYRRVDAGSTVEGAAMGTPPYMAPEQARGERLDERADVYGLGAMLYHVLAGEPPYKGANAQEVMDQVEAGPPVPLAEKQEGIPKDLLAIVDKAMARDKAERYENAKFLAEDLKRFQRGQLVAAHAYSRGELIRRWLARHKLPVAIAAVAVVVITIATTMWLRSELREREVRGRRIAELLITDDSDHETARAQKTFGDFDGAETTLSREVAGMTGKHEADIDARLKLRKEELARVAQIASFYHHAHEGLFLFGDEDRGDDAIYELETALKQVGALDDAGRPLRPNWNQLFPDDLTPEQRRNVQWQAYRLVMSLASMHFKQGSLLIKMTVFIIAKSPEAAAHFRHALDVLALSDDLERTLAIEPARVGRVFQRMALFFLQATGTEQDVAAAGQGPLRDVPADPARAENPVDNWFLGVGHLLVYQTLDSTIGKGLRMTFPDLFDYEHPLETAERQLRLAIRLDPKVYWPHFMLGLALHERGDLDGAELQFDTCILLEPEFWLAYGGRAWMVGARAMRATDPARREEDLRRALADSQLTVGKAASDPVTYWARGDLMRELGRRDDAIDAYTSALELDGRPLEKFSRQLKLVDVTTYVRAQPFARDANALVLLAFASLLDKGNDQANAEAITHATNALQLHRDSARALAIRGTAYLQQDKLEPARADLEATLKLAPENTLAASSRARLVERTGTPAEALAAWEYVERVARVRDHKVEGKLGQYRALIALGRAEDAKRKLDEISRIAPAYPLPKPTTK